MHTAITDLNLKHLYVIYPKGEPFSLHEKITALPLSDVPERLRS